MTITKITPKALEAANIAIPVLAKVVDIFKKDETITVEWTAPNFQRVTVCWGLITFERGERRTFVIQGKPGFCAAIIANLQENGQILRQLPQSA